MPRILIRYDVDNWAFHRRAVGLKRYAPPGYDVTLASDAEWGDIRKKQPRWDAALLCDMTSPNVQDDVRRTVRFVGSHAWLYQEEDLADWRTKGCCRDRCEDAARMIVSQHCDTVTVHNRQQRDFFAQFHPDVRLMPYVVETDLFAPGQGKPENRKLRVGWCGQLGGGAANFKGFVEIMVPLIQSLGDTFEWDINHADYRHALTGLDLVCWYQSLDFFLTTSTNEGGPQPPFEAAACGCVVISTDVGQVSDWQDLRDLGLVVPTYRNADEAAETIKRIRGKLLAYAADDGLWDRCRTALVKSVRRHYNSKVESPRHLRLIAGEEKGKQ